MANEIRFTGDLKITKGTLAYAKRHAFTADLTGSRFSANVQSIPISPHTALDVNTTIVPTAGMGFFINHSATDTIQIGSDEAGAFVPFIRLGPGQGCPVPLASNALYAEAVSGDVPLEYVVFEA